MTRRLAASVGLLALYVACGPPPPPPPPPPPAQIDPARCSVSVSPTSGVVADGTDLATATVVVRDTTGAAMADIQVQLLVTGAGVLLGPPARTDSTGTARLTLRSTVAETKSVGALLDPGPSQIQLSTGATVTFIPGPPGVGTTLTASPLSALDDGVQQITATLTARDSNGNVIPTGLPVTFSLSGSGNTVTPSSGTTDPQGVLVTRLTSTQVGRKTLTATAGAYRVTADVAFVSGPPARAQSALTISPPQVEANGAEQATITVVVRDGSSELLPGQPVSLSVTGSANVLSPAGGTTDINGAFTATLSSTQAEVKTVTAQVGTAFSLSGTVTFATGVPTASRSSIQAVPTTVTAGDSGSAITVTVRDGTGNAVSGQAVSFSASSGVTSFAPATGATNGAGQLTSQFTSRTAGGVTVTAQVGPLFGLPVTITVNPGPASASTSSLRPSKTQAVADGADAITFTATVTDAYGNPLPGQAVVWSATGTGNTLAPGGSTTAADGTATATLTATTVGSRTVTALVAGLTLTSTVSYVAGLPSSTTSTLSLSPATLVAGATGTITVTVRDAAGNVIPGQAVSLAATGTSNTITPASGSTNAGGQFAASFSSTRAEMKQVTATVGSFTLQGNWTVTPAAASAGTTTLAASPGSAIADGAQAITFTLTVRDQYSNPISGQGVSWSATGTQNTLTPGSAGTDSSGVATATLASTRAEPKTVTATAGSLAPQATVTFTPGAPAQGHSSLVASPTSQVVGGPTVGLTVTVRDAFDNPISGAAVTFGATGSGNTLTPASGNTGAGGVLTASLSSITAEAKTASAQAGSFTLTAPVTFTPGPPDQAHTSFTAAPASITAGGSSALTVTVRDAFNNPVPGAAVSLAATGSANTFTPDNGATNASGVLTSAFSSTRAETKSLTATIGSSFTVPASVAVSPAAPSSATSTLAVSPSSVAAGDGDLASITVTVLDAYSNPVPSTAIAVTATGSGNTFNPASGTGTSNASGLFGATLSSTAVETKTVTATFGSVVLTRPITFTVAQPKMVVASAGPGTLGGCVVVTYQVRQAQARPVDMLVEYSVGGGFARATQCGSSTNDGVYALPAAAGAGGTAHTFLWASTSDLPQQPLTSSLSVRLTPSLAGAPASTSMVVSGLSFRNALAFATPATVSGGASLQALAVADVDLDGKPDALVADTLNNQVRVYRGGATGSFTFLGAYTTGAQPVDVAVDDFNGDGKPDFASVNSGPTTGGPGSVTVSFGNGAGIFASTVTLSGGAFTGTGKSIAAGDYNRDGKMDLAVGTSADGVTGLLVYRGDGLGGFGVPVNHALPSGAHPQSLHVADFDRDGAPDLALGTPAGEYVERGNGDGTFTRLPAAPQSGSTFSALPADFDGDGKLDLVTSTALFLRGNGDGTFRPAVAAGFPAAAAARLAEARDLTSDGKLDLAVGNATVTVYAGTGLGTFQSVATSSASATAIAAADLDGDGRVDVASAGGTVVSSVLNAQNRRCDPGFVTGTPFALVPGAVSSVAAHFNADGHLDVASVGATSVSIRLGNGNGTFRPAQTYGLASTALAVGAADFDLDGLTDAAVLSASSVAVLKGLGNGTLQTPATITNRAGTTLSRMAAADFTGDGKPDLVLGRTDLNAFELLPGNGDRTFGAPSVIGLPGQLSDLAAADVNGDGRPDLVAVGVTYSATFLGTSGGTFAPPIVLDVGVLASSVTLGDLNGDGRLDLVVGSNSANRVVRALGNGD
ncbi:MAG TPA: Ig-like domain-containing protein, partial [Myxococcales bacterium]|nr:Ig-like domain-containing protein [Myxococcales bacterium]